jgi:hypothetical protein
MIVRINLLSEGTVYYGVVSDLGQHKIIYAGERKFRYAQIFPSSNAGAHHVLHRRYLILTFVYFSLWMFL